MKPIADNSYRVSRTVYHLFEIHVAKTIKAICKTLKPLLQCDYKLITFTFIMVVDLLCLAEINNSLKSLS